MGLWEKRRQGACLIVELARPSAAEAWSWATLADELSDVFLHERGRARGVVLMLSRCDWPVLDVATLREREGAAEDFARRLQELTSLLSGSPLPVAAVVSGTARGLASVVALSCHKIFFGHDEDSSIMLAEIRSGLIAGGGSLVRLAQTLGVARTSELVALAEPLAAGEAVRLGLALRAPQESSALEAATEWVLAKRRGGLGDRLRLGKLLAVADEARPLRRMRLKLTEKRVVQQLGGGFVAPYRVLDTLVVLPDLDVKDALAEERRLFADLVVSRESQGIHRLQTAAQSARSPARKASRRGFELATARRNARTLGSDELDVLVEDLFLERGHVVLSGELPLASALAIMLASHGVRVRILTSEHEACEAEIHRALIWSERKSSMDKSLIPARIEICGTGFGADEVLWMSCGDDPWAASAVKHLEAPLLRARINGDEPGFVAVRLYPPFDDRSVAEVKASQGSELVARVLRACERWVVDLEAGEEFPTARLLGVWLDEAIALVNEGASIDEVDGAHEEFGFRRGPFALCDELGTAFWQGALRGGRDEATRSSQGFLSRMVELGRLGREASHGFYRYDGAHRMESDAGVYDLFLQPLPGAGLRNRDIVERCLLRMMSTGLGFVCAHSGGEPSRELDCDLISAMVLGFPPWRGGLYFHARTQGLSALRERFGIFEGRCGCRFAEPSQWSQLGESSE